MKIDSKNFGRKLPGFTLVEMLIVVFIIALLATVAIANFGAARQKAKLDIVADTLVSVIKQQQNLAKSKGRCYGLFINEAAPFINLIDADYVSVSNDQKRADYCDFTNESVKSVPEMEDFIVQGLKKDDGVVDSVKFYFKPPFAKTVFVNDSANLESASNSIIQITVSNATKTDSRTIEFDSASGLVSKVSNVSK